MGLRVSRLEEQLSEMKQQLEGLLREILQQQVRQTELLNSISSRINGCGFWPTFFSNVALFLAACAALFSVFFFI